MTYYIKLSTNEYPRHEGDIRLEHPEIGEKFVCPPTYALVEEGFPIFDREKQRWEEITPKQVNGKWQKNFLIIDLTEEEIQERDAIIKESQKHLEVSGSAPNVIG